MPSTCLFASTNATDTFNPGISGLIAHSEAATAPKKHALTAAKPPISRLFRTNLSTTRAVGVAPHARRHRTMLSLAGGRTARSSAVSCASDSSGASSTHAEIHPGRIMAARTVSALQATATLKQKAYYACVYREGRRTHVSRDNRLRPDTRTLLIVRML